MPLLRCAVLMVLCVCESSWAATGEYMDYEGVPMWINRFLGEPSVLSLRGRIDRSSYQSRSPKACPWQCDCAIQWPTALYCDGRALRDIPGKLPDTTQYLFLQGNSISSLSSSALANATELRWLILDHNQLRSKGLDRVGPGLQNHMRLRYLFANHNQLSRVPSGLPAGLQQLRLAHNQISSLGAGAFQDLQNLTVLLLQGNRLKAITQTDFAGLVGLDLLDLSDNLFSSVPKHLPTSIQQLYLSNNSLSVLEDNSFLGLPGLKYLRLSGCGLKSSSLTPLLFNVSSLVELDLSYNSLTVTPTVPTTLQYLYLEANEIKEFQLTSFCREVGPLSYSRLRILRLEGNRISLGQLPPDWVYCLRVLQNIVI